MKTGPAVGGLIATLGFLAVVAGISLLGLVRPSASAEANQVAPFGSVSGVADAATGLINPEEQGRASEFSIKLTACRVRASSFGQGETVPVDFHLTSTRPALAELAISIRDSHGRWHHVGREQVHLSEGRSAFSKRFTVPRAASTGHAKIFCGAWRSGSSLGYRSWEISVHPAAVELLSADMEQRAEGRFAITAQWSGTGPLSIGFYFHDAADQRWLLYGVSLRQAPATRTFVVTIPSGAAIGGGTLRLEWRASDPVLRQSKGGTRSWRIFAAPICRAVDRGLRQCLAQ